MKPTTTPTPKQTDVLSHTLLQSLPLTDIDRTIISHLQQDGRKPFVTIAREIGVTEKTVRAHVKHLLDQNIIQIVGLTTPAALGYSVAALAAINISSPALGSKICEALAHIETIDYVVLTYGRFAIFAEIIAHDMQDLQATIENEIGAIPGISGVEIFPYYSLYYQQANIINISDDTGETSNGIRDLELGDTEKAIAFELNIDGRASFGTIAEHIGISESKVRQRVQHMIAERQISIMAIVNPMKLLDCTMAWVAIKTSSETPPSELAETLTSIPNISYVAICSGRYDIFAEVVCTSRKDLLNTLETYIRPLQGVVTTETFIYANLHYKRLLPVQVRNRTVAKTDTVHQIHKIQA